ncbi:MAG: MarR family transcriptional regulator [Pseudomonadota bacterium]
MPDQHTRLYFELFNEIGIIAQLNRAALEQHLTNGMVLPQFSVLNHLIRVQDGRTPQELASAFQVPKTSMTHTLQGLEKAGFVDVRANEKDKRSKRIWITDAGRNFRQKSIASLGPEIETIASVITPKQVENALPFLRALREHLDAARD